MIYMYINFSLFGLKGMFTKGAMISSCARLRGCATTKIVSVETVYGDHFLNCPFRGFMALTHHGVNLRQCYVLTFCYQRPRYGGDFDYTVS